MSLNNKQYLLQKAETIFDEKKEGANTAARIGQMFKDIINETDNSLKFLDPKDAEQLGKRIAESKNI